MLNKWLRRVWQGKPRIPTGNSKLKSWGQKSASKAGNHCPQLEALEDRTLLSNWGALFAQPYLGAGDYSSSAYVNGTLFFTANDGVHGKELWKSDGTGDGTVLVADINPGSAGSGPQNLTGVNKTLFFTADDGVHGYQIWKSDGTSAGTMMLTGLTPGPINSYGDFTDVNGTVFFLATDPTLGQGSNEIWKSDGTPEGTMLVAKIGGRDSANIPGGLTDVNGTVFFSVVERDPNGLEWMNELWKTDGTSSGTRMIAQIDSERLVYGLMDPTAVNSSLFFWTWDDTNHHGDLWRSDGTRGGTSIVEAMPVGWLTHLTSFNGALFFSIYGYGVFGASGPFAQLWKSDGTRAGTTLVADINPGSLNLPLEDFTVANGSLYFTSCTGTLEQELWKTNGAPAGTTMVARVTPDNDTLPNLPPNLYTIWRTHRGNLTNVNGVLYLTGGVTRANENYTSWGVTSGWDNLWKSDGTLAGTSLVKDVNPSYGLMGDGSNFGLANFRSANGTVFFQTADQWGGTELWKSDGTADGTVMVADISSSNGKFSYPDAPAPSHLVTGQGTGASTIVFSINSAHQLLRHDSVSGWVWLRDNVQSISTVTESSGNVVVFVLTTDKALLRYDATGSWQNLTDPGTIRDLSAGTDVSGLADVFVVLRDGSLTEWQQPSGWLSNPLTGPESVISLSALDQGRVVVVFSNNWVGQYAYSWLVDSWSWSRVAVPGDPMTNGPLPAEISLAQSVTAVTDSSGQLTVFAFSLDGSLWQYQDYTGWDQISTDIAIQVFSAGADASGQANLFALTAAGALMEYQKTSGWSTLNAPGAVQDLSAGTMDQLFVILTDGRVFGRDDQHGFFQI